jgi:cytochrome c oxidase cbb3-type subunit III
VTAARALPAVALAALLASCGSERPPMREGAPVSGSAGAPRTSGFEAGPPRTLPAEPAGYERNPRVLREGERLYGWMNCGGCHGGLGGGGIGPPFADDDWIYGGDPANVFQSIVQGRPNGMPAFGGRLPDREIWKIVAFVRSLAGEPGSPPAPGRAPPPPGGDAGPDADAAGEQPTDAPESAP